MAIEYRLTLAGEPALEDVAARAALDPAEVSQFTPYQQVLDADLFEKRGYVITVAPGRNGYIEAADDTGRWEWEPDSYVDVNFRMNKFQLELGTPNMVESVEGILQSGDEDAALVQNGDFLLLTRFGGVLRKHNRATWWDHYGYPNEIIPD